MENKKIHSWWYTRTRLTS